MTINQGHTVGVSLPGQGQVTLVIRQGTNMQPVTGGARSIKLAGIQQAQFQAMYIDQLILTHVVERDAGTESAPVVIPAVSQLHVNTVRLDPPGVNRRQSQSNDIGGLASKCPADTNPLR